MEGLREPVGSRNRCTLFLGQRGMGKTALLLELTDVYRNPDVGDYSPVGMALKGEASADVKGYLGKYTTDVYGNPRFTGDAIHIGAIQAQ